MRQRRVRVPRGLALVSGQLLRLLALLFLPAAVGVYFLRDLSAGDWLALLAACVLGTLLSLVLCACDCTVIDQSAFAGTEADIRAFCAAVRPVVLLSNAPLEWAPTDLVRVVEKPTLGEPLSQAVRQALRQRGDPSVP